MMRSLLVALLFVALQQRAKAFHTGAGDCPEGNAAVGGPHLAGNSIITGPLNGQTNVELWISGVAMTQLQDGQITLQKGDTYALELYSTTTPYRGFLVRLGGGVVDTTHALREFDSNTQLSSRCIDEYNVGGLTHTNRGQKYYTYAELQIDEVGTNLPLDVTVVMENREGRSEFYYSQFLVNVIDRTTTAAPTQLPTTVPTESPTTVADGKPTESPTAVSTPEATQGMIGLCGDMWAFGRLRSPQDCYALDSGYCQYENLDNGCMEIDQFFSYYNSEVDTMNNMEYYAGVSVSVHTCPDGSMNECAIRVGGYDCTCSNSGLNVTMVDCSIVPTNAMESNFDPLSGQSIQVGSEQAFEIVSTELMCNHPSVIAQTDTATDGVDDRQQQQRGYGEAEKPVILAIPSQLHLWYRHGKAHGDLNLMTRTQLLTKTLGFFRTVLNHNKTFQGIIRDIKMDDISTQANDDELIVAFETLIELEPPATGITQKEVTELLADANWNTYLARYVHTPKNGGGVNMMPPSVLDNVAKVIFRAVSHH